MSAAGAGYQSAAGLLRAFREGQLTPGDVVAELLGRIYAHDPALGSVVALDADRASSAAARSAARWRQGTDRPLEGVPVLVKDLIDTAGLATTYGSRRFRDHHPARDAVAVRRLREAGAVVLGKTATHEFAWGVTTESTAHGVTRNPWDPERVPGGSSGGSAAALAAGFAPLALGTDTAGSVRIPAALCGVCGLKPTYGSVPGEGVFPLARSLDHVGPMARTVADLRLLDRVLRPGAGPPADERRRLRVGILEPFAGLPLPPGAQQALQEAALRLEAAGHELVPVAEPGLEQAPEALGVIIAREGLAVHRAIGLYPEARADYLPGVRYRLDLAAARTELQEREARESQRTLTSTVTALFRRVDAVLSTAVAAAPARIGHDSDPASDATADFRRRMMAYPAWASLSGAPACAAPAGLDADGLPVGLQVCAPWGHEDRALQLAEYAAVELPPPLTTPGTAVR